MVTDREGGAAVAGTKKELRSADWHWLQASRSQKPIFIISQVSQADAKPSVRLWTQRKTSGSPLNRSLTNSYVKEKRS